MAELVFVLGDKLPFIYKLIIAIISYASGGSPDEKKETKNRKEEVNAYARAIRYTWPKAFGEEHVCPRKVVAGKIWKHLHDYHSKVLIKPRKSLTTKRERMKIWRQATNTLFNILRKTSNPNDFEEDERLFFTGQNSSLHSGYISDQIDTDYVEMQEHVLLEQSIEAEQINNELSFIEEEADTDVTMIPSSSNVQLNQSLNRSGLTSNNIVSAEKCIQTEDFVIERPSIRKTKKCTADIKAACAQVSVSCGLSTEMSRVAVQAVSKHLYHHEYYFSIDEVTTPLTSCNKTSPPPAKKKFVKSKSDYIDYKYVLSSAKTTAHFKQKQQLLYIINLMM